MVKFSTNMHKQILWALLIFGIGLFQNVNAQTVSIVQKVVNGGTNARNITDNFGNSVAVSGNWMVVGTSNYDYLPDGVTSCTDCGGASVYELVNGTWTYRQRLEPTGTNAHLASDKFGWSVAISGDYIVVGAYQQDYDASGANFLSAAGAAYVFVRSGSTWSQQQKLVGTGTNARIADDYFGYSVAISGDYIVVGATLQDYDASGASSLANPGAAYVFVRSGSTWSQQQKLVGTGTNARLSNDEFGYSVAISGDYIVVSAIYQDYDASGANFLSAAGAAYVFVRSGSTWSLQQKLVGTGTNARVANDYFGRSVAISGDYIVAGVYQQDYDASGANSLTDAGAAYVFNRSGGTWSLQQKLVGTGTNARIAGDAFGNSVAISGDYIVVGAYLQDYDVSGANNVGAAGAAFVFVRSGSNWNQQQKLVGTGTNGRVANDQFGNSVAISSSNVVLGASGQDYDASGANSVTNAGAVYMARVIDVTWTGAHKIVNGGTNARNNGDNFGNSVAVSGNWMVVGTPNYDYLPDGVTSCTNCGGASVYELVNGTWTYRQRLEPTGTNALLASDYFGWSVAISGDYIVVGAYQQDYDASGANNASAAGAAYVFVRSGSTWSQQQKLVGTGTNGRVADDWFGYSVAISGDYLVVGANQQDYDENGANSLTNSGAAYVFVRSGSTWSQQQKLVGTGTNARIASDNFGYSVAISGDYIVVSALYQDYDASGANSLTDAGAAYVFVRSGGSWSQQQKLVGSGTNGRNANDWFGYSVAISGDYIVVGAYLQDYDASGANFTVQAGAAYVFERSGGTWSLQQKLVASGFNGRKASDYFGCSVGISGDYIVVGARQHEYDPSGYNSVFFTGAAFVFARSGSTWSQQQKHVGTGTNSRIASDNFGNSVAISGSYVALGAYQQDYDASGANSVADAGAVYMAKTVDVAWTGTSSTDWNTAGNWSPSGVPVWWAQIYVPPTTNQPVLDQNRTVGALTLDATTILSLNGYTLTLSGTISGTGVIRGNSSDNSSLVVDGASGTLYMENATNGLLNLTLQGTAPSLTLGNALTLRGVLTLTSGTLTSSGNLTLKAASTSSYAQIDGSGSGTITGNITVQKILSNTNAGWRLISIPVNTTIGNLSGIDLLGSAHGTATERNIYRWRADVQSGNNAYGWTAATTASDNHTNVYHIYGNNANGGFHDITSAWSISGSYVTGDQAYSIYASDDPNGGANPDKTGWNLIPNPYASNLNVNQAAFWSAMPSGYKAIHVWDQINGQYKGICSTGVSMNSYNNGQGTSSATVLAPFQGFWVKTGSNGTLTLTNTMRTTSGTGLGTFMKQAFPTLRINVTTADGRGWDQLVVYGQTGSTAGFNGETDAHKMWSLDSSMPGIYHTSADQKEISIKALDFGRDTLEIGLNLLNPGQSNLRVFPDLDEMPAGWRYYLKDRHNGQLRALNNWDTLEVEGLGAIKDRYALVMYRDQDATGLNRNLTPSVYGGSDGETAFVEVPNESETLAYRILDLQGRELATGLLDLSEGKGRLDLSALPAGVYVLDLPGYNSRVKIYRR